MLSRISEMLSLPAEAKARKRADSIGVPTAPVNTAAVRDAMLRWLCDAQDFSATKDGGAARHYSVVDGWGASYPETTGYIVPTMLQAGEKLGLPEYRERGLRMLDWLTAIQFPEGGIQGGMVNQTPRVPVTFNTGQVLIGLAVAARSVPHSYTDAMHRAAGWLRDSLDADGCWRRHPTPFAAPGEKAYETHVAWGLFEAARTSGESSYADAGLRNLDWAISKQQPSGWFASNCLTDPSQPLTHTIGYVVRGILEGYSLLQEPRLLEAAVRASEPIARIVRADGFLSGRLRSDWSGAVSWCCLTGNAQLASCLYRVATLTSNEAMALAAQRLLGYVLRTVDLSGPTGQRGGVRGSFPIDGAYGRMQYLNWAAKFTIDPILEGLEPVHPR